MMKELVLDRETLESLNENAVMKFDEVEGRGNVGGGRCRKLRLLFDGEFCRMIRRWKNTGKKILINIGWNIEILHCRKWRRSGGDFFDNGIDNNFAGKMSKLENFAQSEKNKI